MDPYYLRYMRRRRLLRALLVGALLGLLALPVLYLLRGEVRAAAVLAYRFAKGQMPASPPATAPAPVAQSTPAKAPPPASAGSAAAQPQPARLHAVKLGEATYRIPDGYIEKKEDLGNPKNPELLLRALLPDLRPRATGRDACAPKETRCPDFATVKLRPGRGLTESEFTKRYKASPGSMPLISGIHGLQQIPPHKAQPGDGRQFLAQPAGRWVWITCRDFGGRTAKQPAFGICHLAFDTADGLGINVRFAQERLRDWSAIQIKATELVAKLRG